MAEKEINLLSILFVIWERGKRIAMYTLLCMVLGSVVTLFIHDRYRAETTLFVNLSKIGQRTMQYPTVSILTYSKLFYGESMLQEIIDEFQLNKPPFNLKYPKDLHGRIMVDSQKEISLLSLVVELEDPEMAAKVTNAVAEKAVKTIQKIQNLESQASTKKISTELNPLLTQLTTFKDKYLATLKKNMKNVLNSEFNSNVSIISLYRQQKSDLDASLQELEKREGLFKQVLSATDFTEKTEVLRKVVYDPYISKITQEQISASDLDKLNQLSIREELINDAWNKLNMEYQKLKVDLPAMKAKRDYITAQIKSLEGVLKQQSQQMADMDVEEMVAKADFDRTLEVFGGIDKQMGWAPTTIASEREDLLIVNPAIPNPKKVYPRRSLLVGLIGMLSFLAFFLYYLMADLYGLVRLGIHVDGQEKEEPKQT